MPTWRRTEITGKSDAWMRRITLLGIAILEKYRLFKIRTGLK
jgi:hypothetical protein